MGSRQVRVSATLKDSTGNPLSGRTVRFEYRVAGSATAAGTGTATTDANGVATYAFTVSTPGTYDFYVYFDGDAQYEVSSASQLGVVVKEKTSISISVQVV